MGREKWAKRVSRQRTICEILREVNDLSGAMQKHVEISGDTLVLDGLKHIQDCMKTAHEYAKKMNKKLIDYSKDYDAGWWEENEDYEKDLMRRLNEDL